MTEQIKKILPDIQNHYVFKDYGFRLIGGTALAYHLKHRLSEDLDFCTMSKLPRDAIQNFIEHCVNLYGRSKVTFIEFSQGKLLDFEINCEDILDYEQNWMINNVKVTFFDGSDNRGVRDIFDADEPTTIGNIEISSVDSIFAMKSLMFYNRAKSRDYYDL
ncbi:nucleotidyl transferase AbiEii/AbiGii toxin family protein, partial [Sulfurimonas sp. SAG-AH-194-C21]